jgi:hypothetical protein
MAHVAPLEQDHPDELVEPLAAERVVVVQAATQVLASSSWSSR